MTVTDPVVFATLIYKLLMVPKSLNLMQKSIINAQISIVVDQSGQYYKKLRNLTKLPPEITPTDPLLVIIHI